MESTTVVIIQSILTYIGQRSKTMTPPQLGNLLVSQCQACITHLRSTELTHAEAGSILSLLSSEICMFSQDQVSKISCVVDEKVAVSFSSSMSASGDSALPKAAQQTHAHLRHYLSEYMWQVILSHMPMTAKLEQCAAFMVQTLLLRNPAEKTRRDMLAVILAATGEECSGDDQLTHVQSLKKMMDNARSAFPSGEKGPREYPSAVETFMMQYPNAYPQEHPPVQCKVAEYVFMNKQSATLCRNTHSSVQGLKAQPLRRMSGKVTMPTSSAHAKREPEDVQAELLRYLMNKPSSSTDLPQLQALMRDATSGDRSSCVSVKGEVKTELEAASPGAM